MDSWEWALSIGGLRWSVRILRSVLQHHVIESMIFDCFVPWQDLKAFFLAFRNQLWIKFRFTTSYHNNTEVVASLLIFFKFAFSLLHFWFSSKSVQSVLATLILRHSENVFGMIFHFEMLRPVSLLLCAPPAWRYSISIQIVFLVFFNIRSNMFLLIKFQMLIYFQTNLSILPFFVVCRLPKAASATICSPPNKWYILFFWFFH